MIRGIMAFDADKKCNTQLLYKRLSILYGAALRVGYFNDAIHNNY